MVAQTYLHKSLQAAAALPHPYRPWQQQIINRKHDYIRYYVHIVNDDVDHNYNMSEVTQFNNNPVAE